MFLAHAQSRLFFYSFISKPQFSIRFYVILCANAPSPPQKGMRRIARIYGGKIAHIITELLTASRTRRADGFFSLFYCFSLPVCFVFLRCDLWLCCCCCCFVIIIFFASGAAATLQSWPRHAASAGDRRPSTWANETRAKFGNFLSVCVRVFGFLFCFPFLLRRRTLRRLKRSITCLKIKCTKSILNGANCFVGVHASVSLLWASEYYAHTHTRRHRVMIVVGFFFCWRSFIIALRDHQNVLARMHRAPGQKYSEI